MLGTRLGQDGDFLREAFSPHPCTIMAPGPFRPTGTVPPTAVQISCHGLLDFKLPEENEISVKWCPISVTPSSRRPCLTPASYPRPRRDQNSTMPSACPPRPRDFSLMGPSALSSSNLPSRSHMGFSRLLAASAHFYLPFFVRLIPLRVCRYINPWRPAINLHIKI